MRRLFGAVSASCLALFYFAVPALAQSTINPNLPANGLPYSSAVIRGQFDAALNDINALWAAISTAVTPPAPSYVTSVGTIALVKPSTFWCPGSTGSAIFTLPSTPSNGDTYSISYECSQGNYSMTVSGNGNSIKSFDNSTTNAVVATTPGVTARLQWVSNANLWFLQ